MSNTDQYLLGYQDEKIKNHPVNYQTNKIGGKPDWNPVSVQSQQVIYCQRCENAMTLVVQLYCPLAHIPNRTLYVFVCLASQCKASPSSWRVVRCQGSTHISSQEHPPKNMEALFPSDASNPNGNSNELTEGVQALHISPSDALPNDTSVPRQIVAKKKEPKSPCFVSYFIYVEEEVLEKLKSKDKHKVDQLYKDYMMKYSEAKEKSSSGESYEKATAKYGDRVTQKFLKIVGQNPEQIIRYSLGGSPLHMSSIGQAKYTKPPPCHSCRAPRHFEFQLMPALVPMLKLLPPYKSNNSPVDFGTVIVSTCSNSCWNGTLQDEHLYIEEDPEAHLLQQF